MNAGTAASRWTSECEKTIFYCIRGIWNPFKVNESLF